MGENDDMNRKSKEEVEKILGRPVAPQFVDDALKVRRNLMVASLVSLFAVLGNVRVDPNSTVLGLKLLGLNAKLINVGTFVVTLYLLGHFAWYVWDAFFEWRLRVTGTKVAHQTIAILGSEDGDYPDDPRQSTLYNWWLAQAKSMQSVPAAVANLRSFVDEARAEIHKVTTASPYNGEILRKLEAVRQSADKVDSCMRAIETVVTSNRVPVSLERFDSWFKMFLQSQNIRWAVVDAGVPLVLGAVALAGLACEFLR